MFEDDYLFRDQVLKIITPNLTIRVLKDSNNLCAACYFSLPSIYHEDDEFEISENLSLPASVLHHPLLCIQFDINNNIPFNHKYDSDFDLFYLYVEARLALLDILKWKECWLNM